MPRNFFSNPYIGVVPHNDRNLYFILSDKSLPLMEDDHIAVFHSAEEAQEVYKTMLYRGKTPGKTKLQVVNFSGLLEKVPHVMERLAPALAREGLAPISMNDFAMHRKAGVDRRAAERSSREQEANDRLRGGFSFGDIRIAVINFQIPLGGLGPAALAAYTQGDEKTRITSALKAAGVTPAMMAKVREALRALPEGASSETKKKTILRAAAQAGIPYTPVTPPPKTAQGKNKKSRSATGSGSASTMPVHPSLQHSYPGLILPKY